MSIFGFNSDGKRDELIMAEFNKVREGTRLIYESIHSNDVIDPAVKTWENHLMKNRGLSGGHPLLMRLTESGRSASTSESSVCMFACMDRTRSIDAISAFIVHQLIEKEVGKSKYFQGYYNSLMGEVLMLINENKALELNRLWNKFNPDKTGERPFSGTIYSDKGQALKSTEEIIAHTAKSLDGCYSHIIKDDFSREVLQIISTKVNMQRFLNPLAILILHQATNRYCDLIIEKNGDQASSWNSIDAIVSSIKAKCFDLSADATFGCTWMDFVNVDSLIDAQIRIRNKYNGTAIDWGWIAYKMSEKLNRSDFTCFFKEHREFATISKSILEWFISSYSGGTPSRTLKNWIS